MATKDVPLVPFVTADHRPDTFVRVLAHLLLEVAEEDSNPDECRGLAYEAIRAVDEGLTMDTYRQWVGDLMFCLRWPLYSMGRVIALQVEGSGWVNGAYIVRDITPKDYEWIVYAYPMRLELEIYLKVLPCFDGGKGEALVETVCVRTHTSDELRELAAEARGMADGRSWLLATIDKAEALRLFEAAKVDEDNGAYSQAEETQTKAQELYASAINVLGL